MTAGRERGLRWGLGEQCVQGRGGEWGTIVLEGVESGKARQDLCSFAELTVFPPQLSSLVSSIQAHLKSGNLSLELVQVSFQLVVE